MKRRKFYHMPMEKPEDFANGDTLSDICVYCSKRGESNSLLLFRFKSAFRE